MTILREGDFSAVNAVYQNRVVSKFANTVDSDGKNWLHHLWKNTSENMLWVCKNFWLSRKQLEHSDNQGNTPFHCAVSVQDLSTVKYFLEYWSTKLDPAATLEDLNQDNRLVYNAALNEDEKVLQHVLKVLKPSNLKPPSQAFFNAPISNPNPEVFKLVLEAFRQEHHLNISVLQIIKGLFYDVAFKVATGYGSNVVDKRRPLKFGEILLSSSMMTEIIAFLKPGPDDVVPVKQVFPVIKKLLQYFPYFTYVSLFFQSKNMSICITDKDVLIVSIVWFSVH